ncbi:glycoside hydrolase family 65 protein [Kordiimonas sp.]|uniref:glycoside hydrolase family 65 protein n=1 Tax=Kordiimonas sp. TaxID=1970157 RepID=UPI003A8E968A
MTVSSADKRGNAAPQFKADPWCLVEQGFDGDALAVGETLFAQANGYIGTRGTFEDPVAPGTVSVEGTFINGVFLREPIHYDEGAFGLATHNNKMILVPDGKRFELSAGGDVLVQGKSASVSQRRSLDMRTGVLERLTRWQLGAGQYIDIRCERFVSLAQPGLIAFRYTLVSDGYRGEVKIKTGLDAAYGATGRGGDPRAGALSIKDCLTTPKAEVVAGGRVVSHSVTDSDAVVNAGYVLSFGERMSGGEVLSPGFWGHEVSVTLTPGSEIELTKYVAYSDGKVAEQPRLMALLRAELEAAQKTGFDRLLADHKKRFEDFWGAADIAVAGPVAVQQGMRFNLFHLFQSAGKDGKRALSAKGLTGAGYDGHYFWDTEIYAVPFFVFTKPEVARALLSYRISTLDKARERARTMAHKKGALFPWRTIGGEECSSYFPAGTGQYHINAAIAYAVLQYVGATGDDAFLKEGGAELLFETARIWMDLGHFNARKGGKFCLSEVTGPDEYTAMADNNLYTNMMAQHHLENAAALAGRIKADMPDVYASLKAKIGLEEAEVQAWAEAAANMYLPYDAALGIHEQCDGFLDKPEWDFEGTPKDHYPLLLHYHPLVIYRHQVLKQPDVVLAQMLLSDKFDAADKRRNLAYYEPRTTHDSTLSACMYAIANAEVGDKVKALEFFEETYRMDIDNRHGNTHYGVHIACMAGSWMGVTYGFAGMRFGAGRLSFRPYLPEGWDGYGFKVQFQGQVLEVEVSADGTAYTLLGRKPLSLDHAGETIKLLPGEPKLMKI